MILYKTLVRGGWKVSICCDKVPWHDGDHFYCDCENAKLNNLGTLEVPALKEGLTPPAGSNNIDRVLANPKLAKPKKSNVFGNPIEDDGSLPW